MSAALVLVLRTFPSWSKSPDTEKENFMPLIVATLLCLKWPRGVYTRSSDLKASSAKQMSHYYYTTRII